MSKYKAIKTNETLKYTEGKEYEGKTTVQCSSILFVENDNGDKVIVDKSDFEYVKDEGGKWGW